MTIKCKSIQGLRGNTNHIVQWSSHLFRPLCFRPYLHLGMEIFQNDFLNVENGSNSFMQNYTAFQSGDNYTLLFVDIYKQLIQAF